MDLSKSKRQYRAFHGRNAQSIYKGIFHRPKQLIFLGMAKQIVYESDKFNGGGDGKTAHYVHEFETPVKLYMDETGKKQLYLRGERLKVTDAGIEN